MRVARKCFISGRVQGVGFRYFAYTLAREYDLGGYVRNLADGRVEVFVQGDSDLLDKFLSKLQKGPRLSIVDDTMVEEAAPDERYATFTIA